MYTSIFKYYISSFFLVTLSNIDDLDEVTHSCKLHDIEEDCFLIEFARKRFKKLNVQTGCGYFEFTKSEYIPPEAQIILMSEVLLTIFMALKVH